MLKKYLCWSAVLHFFVLWGVGACLPPSVPGGEDRVVLKIGFGQSEETLTGDEQLKNRSSPVDKGEEAVQGSNWQPAEKELNQGKKEGALLEEAEERRRRFARENDRVGTGMDMPTTEEQPGEEGKTNREINENFAYITLDKEDSNLIDNPNNSSRQSLVEESKGLRKEEEAGEVVPEQESLITGENPLIDNVDSTEGEETKTAGGVESSEAYSAEVETGTSWGNPDQAPVLVQRRSPRYPFVARRKGWEGAVVLLVKLEADGRVEEVGVLESSGYDLLDQEAVKAVSSWRYEPAYKDGKPVVCQIKVKIAFALKN